MREGLRGFCEAGQEHHVTIDSSLSVKDNGDSLESSRLRQQRVACDFGAPCWDCYGFGVCENETDKEREEIYPNCAKSLGL